MEHRACRDVRPAWTGITQLGVAGFRPKGLDAITPFHIVGDLYRDFAYPGGVYNATFVNDYSVRLVSEDAQAAEPGIKRGDQQCIRDFRAHVKANPRYSLAASALAHPFDDAYWQASPASGISRIDVPVLGCQSWQDGIASSQATELYRDAFTKKTSLVRRHERPARDLQVRSASHHDGELPAPLRGRRG